MLILIAEDDELVLRTVEHKLVKEGHEVVLTRNGRGNRLFRDFELEDEA
ncbi:response regulator [uncultured Sphingobacterium sp.]|nr:response regulator [uncultured Sphingobacterium sp.]